MRLKRVGYWGGDWPDPQDLVDESRPVDEIVVQYLQSGFFCRGRMGCANCRICGDRLGCADMTDGVFVWPQRLDHYLTAHHVQLPGWFIEHVHHRVAKYEDAIYEDGLWLKDASVLPKPTRTEADGWTDRVMRLSASICFGYDVEDEDPNLGYLKPQQDEIDWLAAWLASEGWTIGHAVVMKTSPTSTTVQPYA